MRHTQSAPRLYSQGAGEGGLRRPLGLPAGNSVVDVGFGHILAARSDADFDHTAAGRSLDAAVDSHPPIALALSLVAIVRWRPSDPRREALYCVHVCMYVCMYERLSNEHSPPQ